MKCRQLCEGVAPKTPYFCHQIDANECMYHSSTFTANITQSDD